MKTQADGPISIGVDFGGTSVKTGVVQAGRLIWRGASLATTAYDDAAGLLKAILGEVGRLRVRYPEAVAIGAGLPGLVNAESGVVHEMMNVAGWVDVPLRALLAAHTGLPCVIENDANAMTFAEWKYGAGRRRRQVVCVSLGTGVGGGLILDGKLYRGAQFAAGEIGNMSIDHAGAPGMFGNAGALESYVGHRQITAHALDLYRAAGVPATPEFCTPKLLAEAASRGDEIARQTWERTGTLLGIGLANVVWLLNPDVIVLGGGVAQAGEVLFGPVRRALRERTSPVLHQKLAVVPAELGSDAGLIGAGALAVEQIGGEGAAPAEIPTPFDK